MVEPTQPRDRTLLLVVMTGLVLLNLVIFVNAYPQTLMINSGCCAAKPLAKDFSAYYTGAWRLFHDPSQVYTPGSVSDGEPAIPPEPQPYKYLPSFLLMISPSLLLSYSHALIAFDVFQFLLVPVIALLLYRLMKGRGLVVTAVVAVIVLLQPSPLPHWSLSVSYYWQWAEAQSKVFETFLLLLSFYLGSIGRPKLSGILFGLSAFDLRFALFAIPLFLMYNRERVLISALAALGTLLVSNLPLFDPVVGSSFLNMVFSAGLTTPFYYYGFIPLMAVLSLSIVNHREITITLTELSGRVIAFSKREHTPRVARPS